MTQYKAFNPPQKTFYPIKHLKKNFVTSVFFYYNATDKPRVKKKYLIFKKKYQIIYLKNL